MILKSLNNIQPTMRLNTHIDKTIEIKIRGKSYPVSVAGKGIPCLVIGLSS